MSLKDTARFVRVNDDIYARAPIFEQEMKVVSYVSDEEAATYFASIGADLEKLGLVLLEDEPEAAPAPRRGRPRKEAPTTTILVASNVAELDALLEGGDE
jgi:hypothetical protein